MTRFLSATALTLTIAALATPGLAQTTPPSDNRAPASSGVAAATLPNSFGDPGTTTAPARAPAAIPVDPRVSEVQLAAAALESVIGQFKAGDIDESLFTTEVAQRLNSQLSTYRPLVEGFGALESIEPQGVLNGLGQFLVIFENAATQWQIGLDDQGRIAALRFREAPPESSEPGT